MKSKFIETAVTTVWLEADGIVRLKLHSDLEPGFGLAEAKEFLEAVAKLGRDKKMPVLNDLRGYPGFSSDRETRAYVAGEGGHQVFKAVAFLIDSPVSRVVGNLFLRINKPAYPSQLFTSEAEALEWLKGFVE